MRPPVVPEKVEQQHIIDTLRLFKFEVYVVGHPAPRDGRTHFGTGQTPGIPDLFAFSPLYSDADGPCAICGYDADDERHQSLPHGWEGRQARDFVWVECKRRGGRMSDAQIEFEQLAREVGGRMHHVVGTLDAVITWLIEQRFASPHQFAHYRLPQEVRP